MTTESISRTEEGRVAPADVGRFSDSRLAGFVWAALAVLIFAGSFVVTRFGVTHEIRIWDVTALRFGGGAILLSPVLLRMRPSWRDWGDGFLLSLLWGAPFVLLVALGLQLTSAAQASSLTPALMPVFAGGIGWLLFREAPGRIRLLGYCAIVCGLAVLVGSSGSANASAGGAAALIAAAAMWALYTQRFRHGRLTAVQAAAMICFWSAILYLPFYLALDISRLGAASTGELALQCVYQGLLMSAVAIVAFNRAVGLLGSGAAAAIIALVPVTATALAFAFLGERPSAAGLVAILFISTGVALAARPRVSASVVR
jgi:drug/metabolite transporter (DMT)-like permease